MDQRHNLWSRLQNFRRKRPAVLLVLPLVFVGLLDCIKALRRGEMTEFFVVSFIYFVLTPLLAVWSFRKFEKLNGCGR